MNQKLKTLLERHRALIQKSTDAETSAVLSRRDHRTKRTDFNVFLSKATYPLASVVGQLAEFGRHVREMEAASEAEFHASVEHLLSLQKLAKFEAEELLPALRKEAL